LIATKYDYLGENPWLSGRLEAETASRHGQRRGIGVARLFDAPVALARQPQTLGLAH
jgi:hypothetical protein